jgi:glycosyltransferase involved in cell wall biosynthesis
MAFGGEHIPGRFSCEFYQPRHTASMKYSIIIPSYNSETYLDSTIRSAICALPENDGEIIFIDDCSVDKSLDIARRFKDKIKIYENDQNMGQEFSTNKGLEIANGEYAVILHSDDLLHKKFFKTLSRLLDCYPTTVMAVGERNEINSENKTIHELAPFYDGDYLIPGKEQAKVFLKTGFLPCQVLFRRKVIMSFGGVQNSCVVNLDGLLWFKASLNGDVIYTQALVCSYRKHNQSMTASLNRDIHHMFEYYRTLKEMFNYAKNIGYNLSSEFDAAFRRMSELSIRFSKEIYASGNLDLAKRYLLLAESIDPESVKTKSFIDTEEMMSNQLSIENGFSSRDHSYAPPKGSLQI